MAKKMRRVNLQKAVAISIGIIIADLLVLYLGTSGILSLMWSIAGVGGVTFFGTLMLTNLLSRTKNLDKGEMRKSLAASIILVYFTLIALLTCESCQLKDSQIAETIISHFTYIVGIVIAFYFGTRAIEAAKAIPFGKRTTELDEEIDTDEDADSGEGSEDQTTKKPQDGRGGTSKDSSVVDMTEEHSEPKSCVITPSHPDDKQNNNESYSPEDPLHREPDKKWGKPIVTYALIKGTDDIRENSDVTEKTAMNLAMLSWGLEIPLKLKLVKKDENPDITVNFKHSDEDAYLTQRKREGNNILGYAYRPTDPGEGTLVINDDYLWSVTGASIEAWKVDPEHYSPGDVTKFPTWNLTSTLIHELGHTLGMPHIADCPDCIMHPDDNANFDLHERDIEVIRSKYGPTDRSEREYKRMKAWLAKRIRREPTDD